MFITRSVWVGVVAPLAAVFTFVAVGRSEVDTANASPQGTPGHTVDAGDAGVAVETRTVALHIEGMT